MKCFLKDSGLLLVLTGVICLVIYQYGVKTNALLVVALVLEVLGIALYIVLNRRLS